MLSRFVDWFDRPGDSWVYHIASENHILYIDYVKRELGLSLLLLGCNISSVTLVFGDRGVSASSVVATIY